MRPSSLLRPFKAVWQKSFTVLWGYTQMGGAALLGGLSELNSVVSDPTFRSYLDMFDVPKWMLIAIAILGLITWLAHGRQDA